ncbi:S24 family peptidase [Yersinia rochesterensis]|uniref:S24 family peptidase n=1 Tax=Yersinia rochesterensis TaxID=1604335 RepID=UPI0011A086A6|nr:S24 family peptidase [Yersinia rochesterensis]MDN0108938.1 S24 family peptidase [Yersinia rochesterensis]
MTDTNNILSQNIKYLMRKAQIDSVTELARRLQTNQPTLHRLISGEVKDPKYTTLKQIGDYFRVSPVALTENDLETEDAQNETGTTKKYISLRFSKVPVVGNTQLGLGGNWSDMQYPMGRGDGYILWPTKDDDAYALKCVGDSMVPRIKEGEYVIIEPNHNYISGDEVLVVTKNEEVMVKTFLFERDGSCHLLSVNENHAPIRIPKEEIEKIHYVAGIAKSTLREI